MSYYRPDRAHYYTYYNSGGSTSTYDYTTGTTTADTCDTSALLATLVSTPVDNSTTAVSVGHSGQGDNDNGYWLADVNNGT